MMTSKNTHCNYIDDITTHDILSLIFIFYPQQKLSNYNIFETIVLYFMCFASTSTTEAIVK